MTNRNDLDKVNDSLLMLHKQLIDYSARESYHNGLIFMPVEDIKDIIKLLENYKNNLKSNKRRLEDNPNYWSSMI